MRLTTCQRCRCAEDIPTFQFVKFDTEQRYLCKRCWEDFRRWFHHGAKMQDPKFGSAA